MAPTAPPQDPTRDQALALFQAVEETFPAESLGSDKWYLVLLAAFVGAGHPTFSSLLYTQLIARPEYTTRAARQTLLRRLRETLVKLVILVGVCKPLDAVFELHAVVSGEDQDGTATRETWQCNEANTQRGTAWLNRLYRHNLHGGISEALAANRDFEWITKNITYGLFLSDRSVLDDVETEVVTLAAIMVQNLPRESAWHIRGLRRIAVAKEDVEAVWQCVQLVAAFGGVSLHKVPRVEDVEHEV